MVSLYEYIGNVKSSASLKINPYYIAKSRIENLVSTKGRTQAKRRLNSYLITDNIL